MGYPRRELHPAALRVNQPQLEEGVFIDPSAVVIGDVHIGRDSSIWPQSTVRGRYAQHSYRRALAAFRTTACYTSPMLAPTNPDGYPLRIGDDVTVAHSVTLHGCEIGSRVLIGMGKHRHGRRKLSKTMSW